MSELFTDSTAVKFVNTLNKPPLKLYHLVIKDSAHSHHIELATQGQVIKPIIVLITCENLL